MMSSSSQVMIRHARLLPGTIWRQRCSFLAPLLLLCRQGPCLQRRVEGARERHLTDGGRGLHQVGSQAGAIADRCRKLAAMAARGAVSTGGSNDGGGGAFAVRRRVKGPDAMEALGGQLWNAGLERGNTVLLYGDLGAGKTCLARGIIRAAASDDELSVTSPSYLLDNVYEGFDPDADQRLSIHHMDLYRLSADRDLALLGFPSLLEECLCLIEWPERLGQRYVPPTRLEIELKALDEDTRDVFLKAVGGGWAVEVLENLAHSESSMD